LGQCEQTAVCEEATKLIFCSIGCLLSVGAVQLAEVSGAGCWPLLQCGAYHLSYQGRKKHLQV